MEFFTTSTRNLLTYEAAAGTGHHVALSVVGAERLSESGYFRAKIAQEKLIKESSIPFSIVRATQFFEFVKSIADAATDGNTVRVAPMLTQPMAADDVATAVGRIAVGTPVNGTVETAGPEQFRLDELVRQGLTARDAPCEVVADPHVRYYGAELSERTLVPSGARCPSAETRKRRRHRHVHPRLGIRRGDDVGTARQTRPDPFHRPSPGGRPAGAARGGALGVV